MTSFSLSDRAIDSRRCPMSTRSRASSKSFWWISCSPRRTANRAASFTRLARSAPLIPGVPRADVEVDVGRDALVLAVDLEDLEALFGLGKGDDDRAVEAARAQERRIEDVGAVRGRHHHDALGGLEAVHLREHLIERLLALVVSAAETGAALAADRVDLVDEDDRPSELAGRLEQVAHSRRADADEHLHEVRAGHRQERHTGFTGDGARDERLAGTGRTDEQHAFGDARPDLAEAVGELEEVDDLRDPL